MGTSAVISSANFISGMRESVTSPSAIYRIPKPCDVEGCTNPPRSRGSRYCECHYYRLRRIGCLELPAHPPAKVGADGYIIDYDRARTKFHRQHRRVLFGKIGPGQHPCYHCGKVVSWEKVYPKSLDGLVVDHLDFDKKNNDPSNLVPSCALCNLRRHKPKDQHAGRKNVN